MPKQISKRTAALKTRSIRLLQERLPNFSVAEYVGRWRRYQVLSELGRGAMGVVYRALDTELGREAAVKCILNEEAEEAQLVERFIDEIQIHARLTHPSIPSLYDFGLSNDGNLFMAMELVTGETLDELIHRYHAPRPPQSDGGEERGAVHLTDLLERFIKVCDALSFAHRVGVIHRDLKPDNILCGQFGEVYVMDWGLATTIAPRRESHSSESNRLLQVTDEEREAARGEVRKRVEARVEKERRRREERQLSLVHRSLMGSVVGTIGYMSPEQALGRNESLDHTSDIYALSCMLYHILCGSPPIEHKGDNVWNALDIVIDGRIVPPDQRGARARVPAELAGAAMKGISREPRDRFQEVSALRDAVRDWMRDQARAALVIIEVEENLVEAQAKLEAGRPEDALLLLGGAEAALANIESAERLRATVKETVERATREINDRKERQQAQRALRDLQEAVMESQFGLVLSHLRLPAPTIRRAHDRLFATLQSSGVWYDPSAAIARFQRFGAGVLVPGVPGAAGEAARDTVISSLFLFGWASLRMTIVTAEAHGREIFQSHADVAMRQLDRLAPEYRAPKLQLARLARLRGDEAEALRYEKLKEGTPPRFAVDHIFLATIRFGDFRLEEAKAHILTALGLDPGAFWAHALLIFICNGLGDRDGTFASLRTCQALQPRQPVLWTIKGFLLREYGEFEAAHEALDNALRYGPGDPLARLIRADLRLRLGRIDWQRDLDSAADLVTPPVQTWDYFVLALIALYKNDTEYALEFVHAAQKRSPGMSQLYGLEASILMRDGDFAAAEALLRKALDMSPNDPRIVESLLALLVIQRRYGEACGKFLDDEARRPGAATPNVLLLAARAFAGYGGPEGDDDDASDESKALMLLIRAARTGVIARREVDNAPEFEHLRATPEYRQALAALRDGPPAPRIFQPSIGDLPA